MGQNDTEGPLMFEQIPKWMQYIALALKQGIAFQIVSIVVMAVIVLAYFGTIENPQMAKLIDAVESFNDEHHLQTDAHDTIDKGVEKTLLYLDRNQVDIQRGNQVAKEGFEDVVRGLNRLCWISADTNERNSICGGRP